MRICNMSFLTVDFLLLAAFLLANSTRVHGHALRGTIKGQRDVPNAAAAHAPIKTLIRNLPREHPQTEETQCVLELDRNSISKFRHVVYYSESTFVYLNLVTDPDVRLTGSNIIVGEKIWVWTFYGKDGGLELLNWPVEFGIWSMGLLTSYVFKEPLPMQLSRRSGNCSNVEVGKLADDKIISEALLNLTLAMLSLDEKYGPSFFCHLTRKYIEPHFLYVLCKHIVCPIEALKYNCCTYYYNTTRQGRLIGCKEQVFEYDPFNWILPTIVSLVLFGFCPIFVLYIGHLMTNEQKSLQKGSMYNVVEHRQNVETLPENLILLNGHHHVTFFNTIFSPVKNCWSSLHSEAYGPFKSILRKVGRLIIPFVSLVAIAVQIALDYCFLHTFVLESVRKGVPMGFRSMIAGYKESKLNFLPYLEGPFVAVGIYIFITSILLILPDFLSRLLVSGLPGNQVNESYSPLIMRLRSVERFGSISIRKKQGYHKLYSMFLAQFFMLINKRFWKHVISLQYDRWTRMDCSKCCIVLVPFYFILCLIEVVLCFIYFGFPLISFGMLIIKAYCGRLSAHNSRRTFPVRMVFGFLMVVLIASVVYFFFMFCTIFMDACLFITRVIVFTFTGIVVYPKVSYGYLIFIITVIYYIWQSIKEFSLVYERLLTDIVKVCESLQRANDSDRLVGRIGGCKGINESLFNFVVEKHYPRRKQVFLSVLKVGLILTILGMSINILIETDGFRELHVVMHVGTALFICALPQIVKGMCNDRDKLKHKKYRKELEKSIAKYIDSNDPQSTDSEFDGHEENGSAFYDDLE